ncbi:MAG: transcriptional regulator [Defluviitaleaceae bacterium]|nr:transcriptional regulator [Defluviitaleaceae bacterium]
MDGSLKEQMVQVFHRLHKTKWAGLFANADMDLTALGLMRCISCNSADSDCNVYMVDLQDQLHVSKAAISQMANHLEKKGYLSREVKKTNRRKTTIVLTPLGHQVLQEAEEEFDKALTQFIQQLGDEDARQTVRLFTRFADVISQMSNERQGDF